MTNPLVAPVSLYVIVRDNPNIAVCLSQFRPYVEEIVVVDTGSTDDVTIDLARTVADRVEVFRGCNDPDDRIDHFAMARNRAMHLCKLPATYWCDADDVVSGLENLASEYELLMTMAKRESLPATLHYPYECSWEADGRPRDRPYRERLVSDKLYFRWEGRVHEHLAPVAGQGTNIRERHENIVHSHKPIFSIDRVGRNVRLLEKMLLEEDDKPLDRTLYCLGCELRRPSQRNNPRAKELFTRCLSLMISPDRRINILCHLFEICLEQGDIEEAMHHASGARILHEAGNPTPHWHAREWEPGFGGFVSAVSHLAMGIKNGSVTNDPYSFRIAVEELEEATALRRQSDVKEPLNRIIAHHAFRHFHLAYAALGDLPKAVAACKQAMEMQAFDHNILKMLPQYEKALGLEPSIPILDVSDSPPVDGSNVSIVPQKKTEETTREEIRENP